MKNRLITYIIMVFAISCSNNSNGPDAYGNFEAQEVIISAEAQGKLNDFYLNEGENVKEGFKVGVIDTTALSIQREQLVAKKMVASSGLISIGAQIAVQEEQRKALEKEKNRLGSLFGNNAATQQQMDEIDGKYQVLLRQLEATKSQITTVMAEMVVIDKQVKLLIEQMKKAVIINPIDGTVLEKYIEQNEIAVAGKALYKIARLHEVDLRVYVSGSQLPHLKIGQKVKVFVDNDQDTNREYEGEISWISDQTEFTPKIIQTKEERVNMVYAVKIRVKNDGKLKIGMPGEVKFDLTEL